MNYLVLNDLHPEEQAGAATIAFDFAVALSREAKTQFVSTSVSSLSSKHPDLEELFIERKAHRNFPGYLGEIHKSAIDLFGISRTIRYFRIIKRKKPDRIWVHQIGIHIPRLILAFLPFIAPVVMTAHDYGLIVPRKLYPKDLSKSFLDGLGVNYATKKTNLRSKVMMKFKKLFYTARRFTLKIYLKRVDLVCISEQQAMIFRHFGYKVVAVIPNGIALCTCKDVESLSQKNQVLFLGRLNGKGLERLLASGMDSNIKFSLAGSEELSREIEKFPDWLNARFLGKLNRLEVFREIHKSSFVYLASDCFDVFPTTGLEAIRHGAYPIVSDTTGLADLTRRIHPELVMDSSKPFVLFESLFPMITSSNRIIKENLAKANDSIVTVEQSLAVYLKIIKAS